MDTDTDMVMCGWRPLHNNTETKNKKKLLYEKNATKEGQQT